MLDGQHVASHRTNFNTQNFPTGRHAARKFLALLPQNEGQNDCVKDWEANNATYGLALWPISIIIEVRSPHMSTCCQLVKEVSERKRERRGSGVTMK